jgi:hypothetical protein
LQDWGATEPGFSVLVPGTKSTGWIRNPGIGLSRIWELYQNEEYVLWYEPLKTEAMVVLKGKASPTSQLKAWAQALSVAHVHQQQLKENRRLWMKKLYMALKDTLADLSRTFDGHLQRLRTAGWDVDTAALETSSGRRIVLKQQS